MHEEYLISQQEQSYIINNLKSLVKKVREHFFFCCNVLSNNKISNHNYNHTQSSVLWNITAAYKKLKRIRKKV